MALEVAGLPRIFKHKEQELEDPSPELTNDEVLGFYSVRFPELTTATIAGPEVKDGKAIYTFKTTVGTKG